MKTVPKENDDLDLEAISSSDQHDNEVLTYGPDGAGYEWNIHHSRKLNWKMRHSCQVEVTKRQVGGEAGEQKRVAAAAVLAPRRARA